MRRFLFLLLIVALGLAAWRLLSGNKEADEGPKQKAIAESRHSRVFNDSIGAIMSDYFKLTEFFVNWDSAGARIVAGSMNARLGQMDLTELKKDSSGIQETASSILSDARSNLDSIQENKAIVGQRRAFNMLSQNLYDFLRTVKYDLSRLYLQQCSMAFNEEEPGVWLSRTDSIRNPYMGLHHPHYAGSMITCGETKDTLNFIHTK